MACRFTMEDKTFKILKKQSASCHSGDITSSPGFTFVCLLEQCQAIKRLCCLCCMLCGYSAGLVGFRLTSDSIALIRKPDRPPVSADVLEPGFKTGGGTGVAGDESHKADKAENT